MQLVGADSNCVHQKHASSDADENCIWCRAPARRQLVTVECKIITTIIIIIITIIIIIIITTTTIINNNNNNSNNCTLSSIGYVRAVSAN